MMTLDQILKQIEQLQLSLDEHVHEDLDDNDELWDASGLLEEARSVLHMKIQENKRKAKVAEDPLEEEELERIADQLDEEDDGRKVFEDFRERAFTRGLG